MESDNAAASRPLTDLPDDILYLVIDECMPYGFESLVLTCKKMYALAGGKVEKHNAAKKFDSVLLASQKSDHDGYDDDQSTEALTLFCDILDNPLIPRYIEMLRFSTREPRYERAEACYRNPEDVVSRYTANPTRHKALRSMGIDRDTIGAWDSKIMERQNGAIHGVLFGLVCNLVKLSFHDGTLKSLDHITTIVRAILAKEAQQPGEASLSRLSEVVCGSMVRHPATMPMRMVVPFLALKSLRRFNCTAFDCRSDSIEWPYEDFRSSIEILKLTWTTGDTKGLEKLLKPMHKLRELHIYGAPANNSVDWCSNPIIEVIMRHTGSTLEKLSLIYMSALRDQRRQDIPSPSGFSKLKKLTIEIDDFLPSALMTQSAEGLRIPDIRFSDYLPPRLERLRLKDWGPWVPVTLKFRPIIRDNLTDLRMMPPSEEDLELLVSELEMGDIEVPFPREHEEWPTLLQLWQWYRSIPLRPRSWGTAQS